MPNPHSPIPTTSLGNALGCALLRKQLTSPIDYAILDISNRLAAVLICTSTFDFATAERPVRAGQLTLAES
jgi:hypothetical protein